MSIRKLTNIQQARRILRERRKRCERQGADEREFDHSIHGARLEINPPTFLLSKNEIAQVIRAVSHQPSPFGLMRRNDEDMGRDARMVDDVLAAKRRNGSVSWRLRRQVLAGRVDGLITRQLSRDQALDLIELARSRNTREDSGTRIARRCACNERERVAIDALLETGDRYAERLAKECAKGGGVLEGTRKRRRRK